MKTLRIVEGPMLTILRSSRGAQILAAIICLCWGDYGFSARKKPAEAAKDGHVVSRKMDFKTGRFRRSYRLFVPGSIDHQTATPVPLVIVVHGAFSRPRLIEKRSGFNRLAQRERFLVLYPKGIGLGPLFRHWNAGHCCGKAAKDDLDDVGYVVAAIEDAKRSFPIDDSRIFMTGFSNGAMFTYRFAAERGDLLAAAAPVAGSIGGRIDRDSPWWKPPDPGTPVPMIVFHGLADKHLPFAGGRSPLKGGPREYVSVPDSVAFWAQHNGCREDETTVDVFGGRVAQSTWRNQQGKIMIQLYEIEDWAHDWPGPIFTDKLPLDDALRGFDAAKLIWEFFKNRRRVNGETHDRIDSRD